MENGPEVLGEARDRADGKAFARGSSHSVFEDALFRCWGDQVARVLVAEHAAERSRLPDAAANVRPEAHY